VQLGQVSGRTLAVGAALALAAAAGGVLIGHYAWTSGTDTARADASPNARRGTPPNRLDANQSVVLSSPRVRNLYWDDSWNSRSAHDGFHRGSINHATEAMLTAGYLRPAAQYGVGTGTYRGSFSPSPLCGPTRAPTSVHSAAIVAWVTCMATVPFTGVPHPTPRVPVSNDLYVVYLPARTSITSDIDIPGISLFGQSFGPFSFALNFSSCTDFHAYHSFSISGNGPFPFAVVPTRCFRNDSHPLKGITRVASHEIVEAATDPVPQAGRFDNSATFRFAEAGDICQKGGAAETPGKTLTGTAAVGGVPIPVDVFVSSYWSNSAGACVTSNAG
jgi:hypothetical protein